MTYDDAEWHCDTVLDLDLDESAAVIHIGVFLAWATARGLLSETLDNRAAAIHALEHRTTTPSGFAEQYFVAQIDPLMLSDSGNRFTDDAYARYLEVLQEVPLVAQHATTYEVPDDWGTFDAIVPYLDRLYDEWRADGSRL
ncbi:DUF7832 domain-containing protein [Gordonia insulae]|uniref:DUF7832 domain-containing protein n=1 Tax=Gordonia insulae TaxID=2420509 RepID=A0A3G8JRY8_9ACTN|nr:hypothetical protein [Gordonia insulae]AZG47881.1 hypothetical protein D7316_04493 [Gordonia insulae]